MTSPNDAGEAAGTPGGTAGPRRLAATDEPLGGRHDVALLDLDGVVYVGAHAVPGAVEHLRRARAGGLRLCYVTNNASRRPGDVAAQLREVGLDLADADVVTAAQAAARLVAGRVPAGARVLVVGGDGLDQALAEHGLRPVRSLADDPAAVVQGFDPAVDWRLLAEGSYAVAAGLPWVASNLDLTVPTARGIAPGNGTLVAAVRAATGVAPLVAGKPEPALVEESVLRTGAARPLTVGDRLDTDISGATRYGMPSLLVLTGVTSVAELLAAAGDQRPDYVAPDLAALLVPHPEVILDGDDPAGPALRGTCAGWSARVEDAALHLEQVTDQAPTSTPAATPSSAALAAVRAAVAVAWAAQDRGTPVDSTAASAALREMMQDS